MSALAMPNAAQQLCLECGLCCNGVLFAHGQLQPEDNAEQLRALGLKLIARRRTGASNIDAPQKFSQPCAAFDPRDGGVPPGCAPERDSALQADRAAARPDAGGTFRGCQCTIYSERPAYCRAFECTLLKQVNAGRKTITAALKTIDTAKKRAEKVRRLLRELGCADRHVALPVQFRRVSRRMQSGSADRASFAVFGDLTVAMQQLNVVLSREFYPG